MKFDRFKIFLLIVVVAEVALIAALIAPQPGSRENSLEGEPENPTDFTRPVEGDIPYVMEPNISEFTDGYAHKIPSYWVRTNSHGLRGEEFDTEPPGEVKRVLVVGDSHTFGWGVNRSKRFTNLLEERLNSQPRQKYQVVNAGVPGWGMEDYYAFLKERGLAYSPDLVIIAFAFSDVLSVEKTREFLRRAEHSVPENATERNGKVLQKHSELKRAYFKNASVKDSDLGRYMREISALGERHNTSIAFYYFSPMSDSERESYESITRNYSSVFIHGSTKFTEKDKELYTLPGKDTHYNELGHRWMADRLYEELNGRDILEKIKN